MEPTQGSKRCWLTSYGELSMATYEKGQSVKWDWGNGTAEGKVDIVHTDDITKTIKGTDVKREASKDSPAYTIKQDDGSIVLKSHTEIRKA